MSVPGEDLLIENRQAEYIERLQAEVERLTGQRDRLLDAGRRSLNWLASYPGGGALGCYDEMRAAVHPLESVLTKHEGESSHPLDEWLLPEKGSSVAVPNASPPRPKGRGQMKPGSSS